MRRTFFVGLLLVLFGLGVVQARRTQEEVQAHSTQEEGGALPGEIQSQERPTATPPVLAAGERRTLIVKLSRTGEKKVYFEFSDYSTSYVFYESPE